MPVIALEDLPTTRPGGTTRIFEGERNGFVPNVHVPDGCARRQRGESAFPPLCRRVRGSGRLGTIYDGFLRDVAEGHVVIVDESMPVAVQVTQAR